MLFTPRQYAALNYTGRDLKSIFLEMKDTKKNHIEELDKIDRDPAYKQDVFLGFLEEGNSGKLTDPIDKRIYDCLVEQLKGKEATEKIGEKQPNVLAELVDVAKQN